MTYQGPFKSAAIHSEADDVQGIAAYMVPHFTLRGAPEAGVSDSFGERMYFADFDAICAADGSGMLTKVRLYEACLEELSDRLPEGSVQHGLVKDALSKIDGLDEAHMIAEHAKRQLAQRTSDL